MIKKILFIMLLSLILIKVLLFYSLAEESKNKIDNKPLNQPSEQQNDEKSQSDNYVGSPRKKWKHDNIFQPKNILELMVLIDKKVVDGLLTSGNSSENSLNKTMMSVLPQKRFALLIGINNYADKNIPHLKYAVNDAEDFCELFLDPKFNFPKSNIKMLLNNEATKNNIFNSIKSIDSQMDNESILVVTFSGHGYLQKNLSNDDPYIEYFIPYDGIINGKKCFISDLEFFKSLNQMKSQYICVFIDACFGGGSIDYVSEIRTLPNRDAKTRGPELFRKDLSLIVKSNEKDNPNPDSPLTDAPPRIIIFTAAAANQAAHELSIFEHGVFSYFILCALYNPYSSDRDVWGITNILNAVRKAIKDYNIDQIPILEDSQGNGNYFLDSIAK